MGFWSNVTDLGEALMKTKASEGNAIIGATTSAIFRCTGKLITGAAAIGSLACKDYGEAAHASKNIASYEGKKIKHLGQAAASTIKTAATGGFEKLTTGSVSPATKSKLKKGAAIAGVALISSEIASEIIDAPLDIISSADGLLPTGEIPGVHNGVFTGTSADLNKLVSIGEIDDAHHIDVIRDPAVVHSFLHMYGFSEQPDGYEVHHIIPLSEGGADSTDNMVLIREDQHDYITAKHREYYGW